MRLLVFTCLVAPAFAQVAGRNDAPLPVLRTGAVFEVTCRFGDDRAGELALAAAEAAWPLASALFGAAVPPERPYPIQLFRNPENYRAVERVVTGGRFRNNLAFTSWETRKTYIAVQPECSDAVLERIGLPALTRRLLLHEATHLVCYHAMANYRAHPEWLAEGLANWVADEVMRANGWSRGREAEPITATDIQAVQGMLASGTLPGVERIFADDLAAMSEGQRYALAWTFVDFLMRTRRAAVIDVLRELGALPGADVASRLPLVLADRLAPDGTAALEEEFHAFLRSLAPEWRVSTRSLSSFGDDWLQLAFRRTDAAAWRADAEPRAIELRGTDNGASFAVSGELEIVAGERMPCARVLLGQWASEGGRQENYAYVEFEAGYGIRLKQAQIVRTGRGWNFGVLELGAAEEAGVAVGATCAFRIAVADGRVRVFLGGELALDQPFETETLTGTLGLGASAGTAVLWRHFATERLAPAKK